MLKYLPSIFKREGNTEHNAILGAIKNALDDTRTNTDDLQNELKITTATSEWLDRWGEWFGVKRQPNETDSNLQTRILSTLTQDKLTIPALTNIVKNVLGQDTTVTVYEPYTDTFVLGHSMLNQAILQDGEFYRIGVVRITVNKPLTDEVITLLQLAKPAGVKLVVEYRSGQDLLYAWQIV